MTKASLQKADQIMQLETSGLSGPDLVKAHFHG